MCSFFPLRLHCHRLLLVTAGCRDSFGFHLRQSNMFELMMTVLTGLTGEGFKYATLTQNHLYSMIIHAHTDPIQSDVKAHCDYNWPRGRAMCLYPEQKKN